MVGEEGGGGLRGKGRNPHALIKPSRHKKTNKDEQTKRVIKIDQEKEAAFKYQACPNKITPWAIYIQTED